MYDLYDPAEGPACTSELIRLAADFDFIHLVIIDVHGMPRVKVYPADIIETVLNDGVEVLSCCLTTLIDGGVVVIPDLEKISFGNIRIRPVIETTRKWPWWNVETDTKALQIFGSPEWLSGVAINADPRRVALSQLKRLHDRGLDIFWGIECEYRLYKLHDGPDGEPIAAHDTVNLFHHPLVRQYEKIYVEMNNRMRALGFKYDVFHSDFGSGQVEFPLTPDWGIKSADDVVRFKMLARDVAADCGYKASFMTKVIPDQTSNGFHLNHSIWKKKEGQAATENAMLDNSDPDKISGFARHWMAGILQHSTAITAITSPTVNCYRRLHTPWCPSFIDWGIDNRFATLRFKNGGTNNTTFLENRCPSSAANPYLALAVTIAAGLDGVDRALPLVSNGSRDMGPLPRTLFQALEALKKDEVICSALGEQFIEWYGTVKLDEINKLGQVDVTMDRKYDMQRERKMYFDFV